MSALNELRERYKILPLWGRLLAVTVIGFFPAAYIYFDEGAILEESVGSLEQQVEEARVKFREATNKHANLPKLEKDLQATQEQLAKAKRKLPDNYKIEDILEKVSTIANGSGVLIREFSPQDEVKKQEPYPYVELPINIEVAGVFAKVTDFLNGLIHLEGTVFLKGIDLKRMGWRDAVRVAETINGATPSDANENQTLSKYKKAQQVRESLMVKATITMAVYRSMDGSEVAAPVANPDGAAPNEDKGGGKKRNKKGAQENENASIKIPYRAVEKVAMSRI
jgi:Tfp pilus assembly protein PilO